MWRIARWLLLVFLLLFFATLSYAQNTICSEDPANGCVGAILTSSRAINVGADAELSFDSFSAGYDTSDGIQFPAGEDWTPDPAFAAAFPSGFLDKHRQQHLGSSWGHPCGAENEPPCEPIAKWDLVGSTWDASTPSQQQILESDGSLSEFSQWITLALEDRRKLLFNPIFSP